MLYIADTHSLVWFLIDSNNLSRKAKEIFENVEAGHDVIVIPTIVLAEILYICEKKGIENKFSQIINLIKDTSNYIVYNLDLDVIIECKNLIKIREMHDKLIVATAKILKGIIITKDKVIINSEYVKTIW